MLKKMRWRFIGSAMAAFLTVVLSLVCVVNFWNYRTVTEQQDETLQRLLEADRRSTLFELGKPPFANMGNFSMEVPYMIRYFSITLGTNGDVVRVNQNYIASISREDAANYALKVCESGREHGYYMGYRYLLVQAGDVTDIFFLNSEREIQSIRSLIWMTVAIALCSLVVVFILVVLFSERAIAPYLRNLETQKQFITNASHELKTPLTAIATSADVLAMEQPEDEWVQSIQTQAARLSKLITNLITLSRLNEENPFPVRSEFSMSEALWEIAEPFVSLAQARGRTFAHQIQDDLIYIGNREAVQQMVSILLDNAVKYTPEGGEIELITRKNGKQMEIEVSNSCDRQDDLNVDRLFDRFYRADESHSAAVSGTGIGLSIAKATAEAHGGTIRVIQQQGRITFTVRL